MTDDTPTPRTDAEHARISIHGLPKAYHEMSDFARQLERGLARVTAERDEARAEQAYLKLQRDRLLEITWLDLPDEPHESTHRWQEEFDRGWKRREPHSTAEPLVPSATFPLRGQREKTLIAERDKLKAERDEARARLRSIENGSFNKDDAYVEAQQKLIILKAEKEELLERLSYVTTELLKSGVDCGAAPVEELARRVVKQVAAVERERDEAMEDHTTGNRDEYSAPHSQSSTHVPRQSPSLPFL